MTSEIRVNKLQNRVGLGTVEYTNTGIVVSGIVTCTELSGLTALNIAGVGTANTLDINGDIDVDGHTNLDNVSVAGVSTFSGTSTINTSGNEKLILSGSSNPYIQFQEGTTNKAYLQWSSGGGYVQLGNSAESTVVRILSGETGLVYRVGTNNRTVWTSGNDGASSGLDADLLDGQQGSYYTNAANLTGTLPAIDGSNLTGISQVGGASTVSFNNNVPIYLGDNNDYKIYFNNSKMSFEPTHSGTQQFEMVSNNQMYIHAKASGLFLRASNQEVISIYGGSGGGVYFRHNNTQKLKLEGGNWTYENGATVTHASHVYIPDSIIHVGDTTCKIRFPANDTISFETGGSERLRITSGGCVYANNFGIGVDDRWKIRPNTSNTELAFEYSTSASLSDTNIKMLLHSNGTVTIGKNTTQGKAIEVYQSADAAIRIQNSTTGTGSNDGILIEAGASQALVWNYESTPLKFGTAGTERFQITSGGNALFGGTGVSQTNRQLVVGSNAEANFAIETHNTSASETANVRFYRSRGTAASPTTLVDGDMISQLLFYGHDGTDYSNTAARIRVHCSSTVANNSVPSSLTFSTFRASTTVCTEALRLTHMQDLTMGNGSGYSVWKLTGNDQFCRYQFRQTVGDNRGAAFLEERGDSNGMDLFLSKSRGGNGKGAITAGDQLGFIRFSGGDGTRQHTAAAVGAYHSGTVATGRVAGNLAFYTAPDSVSDIQQRLLIEPNGRIKFVEDPVQRNSGAVDNFSGDGAYMQHYVSRDGSTYRRNLDIAAVGDGTWGCAIRFSTNRDGSATSQERLQILKDGGVYLRTQSGFTNEAGNLSSGVGYDNRTRLYPYWVSETGACRFHFSATANTGISQPRFWLFTNGTNHLTGKIEIGMNTRTNSPSNAQFRNHQSTWQVAMYGEGDNDGSGMRYIYQEGTQRGSTTVSTFNDYYVSSNGHSEYGTNDNQYQNGYGGWYWKMDGGSGVQGHRFHFDCYFSAGGFNTWYMYIDQ